MKKITIPSKTSSLTSFLDLLFIMLLGFAFMFIIAFLLINPPESKKIDPKAEAMIIMTWPDGNYDDVDLWVKLPNENFVGFVSMDQNYVHLERDDLGLTNDKIQTPTGLQITKINREVIMFRQLVDGHYIVNVHFYNDHDATPDELKWAGPETEPAPIPVKVTIIQLNPVYKELGSFLVILEKEKDEKTVVQFNIENKQFENFNMKEQHMFVNPNGNLPGALHQGGRQ